LAFGAVVVVVVVENFGLIGKFFDPFTAEKYRHEVHATVYR